ncbi:MAG: winged helix-turn-helix transcriptional regulator [Methanosarcinales archaeon]|nr:winged helix-turn-helix transcriptional regulator [Methanosarcinales archaeon]
MEDVPGDTEVNSHNKADNKMNDNSEKLLVLPLGDESKKITQVITNDTARHIMELLAEHSMSASDIAKRLDVPLTTIKYNLENLVDVGLAKIERIKYSEKGRQVKVYAPVRKLIVVVPEKLGSASITEILKKYLGVILTAVFASGFIELLTSTFTSSKSMMPDGNAQRIFEDESSMDSSMDIIGNVSGGTEDPIMGVVNDSAQKTLSNATVPDVSNIPEAAEMVTDMPSHIPTMYVEPATLEKGRSTFDMDFTSHLGLWFLMGCLFMIALVMIVDYYRQKKAANRK